MSYFSRINSENGDRQTNERLEADANTPGLHISTFIRQIAFDVLYYTEFIILLVVGFSAPIVKDGYLGHYTTSFIWVICSMTILSMILKFFYYNVLHIWSNTIFTTTRIRSQPFEMWGSSKSTQVPYITSAGETKSRFIEYVFISSNSWFLGKLKTVKTTIMILPSRLLQLIETQGKALGGGVLDPLDRAAGGNNYHCHRTFLVYAFIQSGIGTLEEWKEWGRNLLHWRKTIALLCFFPLLILGILVPLIVISVLVLALVLSLPLMILLVLYNVFGNCRNIVDRNLVDNDEFMDRDIEDLPPEIDSIENLIFSCDPKLTLRKVQGDLADRETLDLSGKPEMSVEELENITVLLLSLNPRRYKMRELNLDDSRLTDEKMQSLAPLIVRFHTVKIGGKQDYGERGLQELRLYMEGIQGTVNDCSEDEIVPLVKSEKIMLRRLEIKQSKSRIGVTDLTWVNEEVKGIENEDEKALMTNELANMIPYLNTLILDGFLRESVVKPVNSMIGRNKENSLWQLWQKLNFVDHMEKLSLRDCDINDRIILKCLTGISNIRTVDLSGNPGITHIGWKGLADTLRLRRQKKRLISLIYQQEGAKNVIDDSSGQQLSDMFQHLHRIDLQRCTISDGAVRHFIEALSDSDSSSMDRVDLTDCVYSASAIEEFIDVNRRRAAEVIVFKEPDESMNKMGFCGCFRCCCCKVQDSS